MDKDAALPSVRVTILMTVYNGEAYLNAAIDSALAQTRRDFEFVIIDDASTDQSWQTICSYNDPRIRRFQNPHNLGQTRSLNLGLTHARGEYVARLDQDDVCLPERLEDQVAFMDARPDVAVTSTWEYSIDSAGQRRRLWRATIPDYGHFLGTLAVGKCPIWHPSAMFRTADVVAVGGYDPTYQLAEDFDLWLKLAMRRKSAALVPRVLVLQRSHASSQSVQSATAQRGSLIRSHQKLVDLLCPPANRVEVGRVLRLDDDLTANDRTKATWPIITKAISDALETARVEFALSSSEFRSMRAVVYKRLGPAVGIGRARWVPAIVFPTLVLLASPRLSPTIRDATSSLNRAVRYLRFPRYFAARLLNRIRTLLGLRRGP